MIIIDKLLYAYWFASGASATRTGQYERALECFARAIQKRRPRPILEGYRAIALMLDGRKEESRAAFRALALAKESKHADDEYARLYARMYVAYLDDDLNEADRLAVEIQTIACPERVKRILVPIEKPSALALGANADLASEFDVELVRAHFQRVRGAYDAPDRRLGKSLLMPDGSP